MRLIIVLLVVLAACTGNAVADVYRYTDEPGELHFVDDVAKVPKKYRKQLENAQPLPELSVMDAAPAASRQKGRAIQQVEPQTSYGNAGVELYMTSWCGYCKKMVKFLDEKKIQYTAYDIEKDSNAARTYRQLGGNGVPVVRIGSHVVHGYDPDTVMSYVKDGR